MCFKDEEVITVGSSAYNLAGDVASRGNFMKNNILSMIFSGTSKNGMGAGIVDAHLAGPASSYIRFAKWAETSGYNNQVGNLNGLIYSSSKISTAGFNFLVPVKTTPILPVPATPPLLKITHERRAITSAITGLDIHLIALEWIIKNAPTDRYKSFKATVQGTQILITYDLGGIVVFTPAYNLNSSMPFLYLYYEERLAESKSITDTGWLEGTPPARVDFVGSSSTVAQVISRDETKTTTVSYSDSTPSTSNVEVTPKNLTFNKVTGTYTKVTTVLATLIIKGKVTTLVQSEESLYTVVFTNTSSTTTSESDDVTTTTTVTTSTPSLAITTKYKLVTTIDTKEKWLPYLLKIYQKGSSVEGDALLFSNPTAVQKFFPVIPLRRDNVMVDLANFPTQYDWNRKAAKRCFGTKQKYDSLIESLTDNPDLESIDHAWVVFGVSLSTKQQDGQKYLFNFFKNLADTTFGYTNAYKSPTAYENAWVDFLAAVVESTNDEKDGVGRPIPPISQDYTITINSSSGVQNWLYNTTITAKGGGQIFGSGYHVKSANKVGNCWVYTKSTIIVNIPVYSNDGGPDGGNIIFTYPPTTTTVIAFGKQVTSDSWVEYEFFDLVHVNNVYQGISTTTLGATVMSNPSENSSFIIPIHEGVFKEMTLIRRTQFSLEATFLVVNYYDKQVIPWYASSFFQIVLVIVVIIVAVSTGYISSETLGVLGANGAVGGALGFTGLAATVAGAIANSVAAAIISSMILKVAVSALGEDVGKIIGFIASVYAMNWVSSDGAFNIADTWVEFTKAENLVKLSMSGIQEYGSYLQGQAVEINAKTQAMMVESNEALKGINQLMQELLGDSGVNSSTITDALRYASETPAQFLDRTTMTGTEIAELSIKLVESFPAPQLKLPYTSE